MTENNQLKESFNVDALINQLEMEGTIFNVRAGKKPGIMDTDTCAQVVQELARMTRISPNEAMIAISLLILQGGTSRNAQTTMFVFTQGNQKITLGELRMAINNVDKGATVRKFARGYATQITRIALAYKEKGNLHKSITRKYPQFTTDIEKLAWFSDFNTDNPDCPEDIREILNEDAKERFGFK